MNRDTWLGKLKPKNLVTLYNSTTKQKINVMIHRINPEFIHLNNDILILKNTGQSVDSAYSIEPLK